MNLSLYRFFVFHKVLIREIYKILITYVIKMSILHAVPPNNKKRPHSLE